MWKGWSTSSFNALDTDDMENIAGVYQKRVGKLGREIKRWGVWENMKNQLDKFRGTMCIGVVVIYIYILMFCYFSIIRLIMLETDVIPLIQDLRNPALRPRHWYVLKTFSGTTPCDVL
jgi:dynein heavy chain, axonemal